MHPGQVVVEESHHPRLAAGLLERRHHDILNEVVDGPLQHVDLKRLLRLEMSEEAALREIQAGRQNAERHPLQADLTRQGESPLDDLLARLLSFAHGRQNSTVGRLMQAWLSQQGQPRPKTS